MHSEVTPRAEMKSVKSFNWFYPEGLAEEVAYRVPVPSMPKTVD